MNCPVCGADTGAATAFCPNCGSRIDATALGADSSPFTSPGAPPPAAAASPGISDPPGGGSYAPPSNGGGSYTPPGNGGGSYTPPGNGGGGSYAPPGGYGSPYASPANDNVTRPAVNVTPPPGAAYPPLNSLGAGVVSVKSWLGTLLLLMLVPLVLGVLAFLLGSLLESVLITTLLGLLSGLSSIILILIFAFSKKVNPSKRNFFKASLIMVLISIGISIVLGVLFTVFFASVAATMDWESILNSFSGLEGLDPSLLDL